MIRNEFERFSISYAYRVSLILWVGVLIAPVILGFVAYVSSRSWAEGGAVGLPDGVMLALYALGGLVVIGSLIARRIVLTPEWLIREVPRSVVAETKRSGFPDQMTPESPAEERLLSMIGQYQAGSIITASIAEVGAIIGFLLAFYTHDLLHLVRLGGLAMLVVLFFHRPTRTAIEEAASLLKRQAF